MLDVQFYSYIFHFQTKAIIFKIVQLVKTYWYLPGFGVQRCESSPSAWRTRYQYPSYDI